MNTTSTPLTYRLQEGELTLPPGWTDQSMQVFRLPGEAGRKDASFLVTRDHETPIEKPAEYALAQKQVLRRQFPGFRVIKQEEMVLDGEAATMIDYEWVNNGVPLRQRQVYLRHESCMLTLTLTARSIEFAAHESVWTQVVGSFRLRRPEPGPAPQAHRG